MMDGRVARMLRSTHGDWICPWLRRGRPSFPRDDQVSATSRQATLVLAQSRDSAPSGQVYHTSKRVRMNAVMALVFLVVVVVVVATAVLRLFPPLPFAAPLALDDGARMSVLPSPAPPS